MNIGIGSDHRGYELKEKIKKHFGNIVWVDVGTNCKDVRVDYPIYTKKVCEAILKGEYERGIVICGSGIGVSISANRFPKIYAALCWSPELAQTARKHNHANLLALPSDFIDDDVAFQIVNTWLKEMFDGERHEKRLEMLEISDH